MSTALHNTRKQKTIFFLYNIFTIILRLGHGVTTVFLDYQLVQMSIKQ